MRLAVTAAACCLLLASCATGSDSDDDGARPAEDETSSSASASDGQSPAPTITAHPGDGRGPSRPQVVDTVARGLQAPWGLDFLPDGTALVTERDTRRVLTITDGRTREVGVIDAAAPQGESGLLGVAVSPDFRQDHRVFFYLTTAEDNRIVRTTFEGGRLGDLEPIVTGIPHGFIHDGGRLEFDDEGYLYASTGETGDISLAQDPDSLGGKILRMTQDGEPAPGNPDPDSLVWTSGHRNVQGLAFDDHGRLWASEFGDQTFDELNRIRAGSNYGWPEFEGTGGAPEFADPRVVWRTSEASPSGLAWLDGHLWMASLRGERLWRIPVRDDGTVGKPRDFFVGQYGRLRTIVVAPDGNLWVTTSNRDSRGDPQPGDDRILVVSPG